MMLAGNLESLARRALNRHIDLPAYFTFPVLVEEATAEDNLCFLRVRTRQGRLEEVFVEAAELEVALARVTDEGPRTASPGDFALFIEAARIRLAYTFDPHFAVSLSGIEPLPHQLEAVYQRLLPQTQLRFLLADDPGAGKTIMTGLLVKELKMRGAIERVLVLCPAPLTIQWQDEMRARFDEVFEVIRSEFAKDQLAGNIWDRFPQCIASIDFAKQADVWPGILRAHWDLVVIDEAHKCAARTYGREVKKTQRYQLAERLSAQIERLLLLTATPHQGDPDQFAHFLRLLDADQFVDPHRVDHYNALNRDLLRLDDSPWFLRRIKEGLRDFEGRKLFTERHPITVPFELSAQELHLYNQVTDYINAFLPRQQSGRRRMSVALARTVLQRRLASSIRAIHRSLERRHERFSKTLDELRGLTPAEQRQRLQAMQLLAIDEEQEFDDQDEAALDEAAAQVTAAERIDDLRREVRRLAQLIHLAKEIEAQGTETKLSALHRCLDRAEFAELRDGRGKLLIFTEHKDTLDYLREQLEPDYICCEIHGGMNAQQRKDAQDAFYRDAQVCIATEAAGEGINLQFCHLMINYDIPWNPNRLEQRMGRIHRIGQKYDVYVFNFVAVNTIEGKILTRLLDKLDEMRTALGGRVFDVINLVLKLNEVNLEEMLREAVYNPARIEEYEDQIERVSPNKLKELEEATGIAMATGHVDFGPIQAQDFRSEERRLMPEYVEDFFEQAAGYTGLRLQRRADELWRVEHVPERFRSTVLQAVKRFGVPKDSYRKLTFNKRHLQQTQHLDAELLSPGHPLFAAVAEVLDAKLAGVPQSVTAFIDPATPAPYSLHFFEVQALGETPGTPGAPARQPVQHAELTVVLEDDAGELEPAPPDILHDLTPVEALPGDLVGPDLDAQRRLERWVRVNVQRPAMQAQRAEREREITIRRDYLEKAFDASIRAQKNRWAVLAARVAEGDESFRLARDEAMKRVDELDARRADKLAELAHLRVLRPGPVRYLGTVRAIPPQPTRLAALMRRDDEVEAAAMAVAMQYERERGWEPTDVSKARDGSGFDIRSVGPPDAYGRRPVRRIEVKGRAQHGEPVMLSRNEWVQAGRHGDAYWLYVVWGCKTGEPRLQRIQNPARKLAGRVEEIVEVKGYLAPADAITRTRDPE
ncbi:MAG: DUF3883 domain-containing protein [Anaerolineae bacterium]|nr:DUF3883 domain-containing protein [Anaerolineae bacterium]